MKQLFLLSPEIFLSLIALTIFIGDAFTNNRRKPWIYLSVGALLIVLCSYIYFFIFQTFPYMERAGVIPNFVQGNFQAYGPVLNMVEVDSLAIFFKIAIIISVLLIIWMSVDYYEFKSVSFGPYVGLLLLGTVGMLLLVGTSDLVLAVISLELLGVSSFIMTGYILERRSSSEAALKYFLVGSLSTAILLFGISYYYGYFGTTSIIPLLQRPAERLDPRLALILIFLLGGLGFKLAMVPFHMWAPDAYEGAPTPVTAFLSVAPKAAAVGFVVRLFAHHSNLQFTPVLAVLAALTMTVGNLGALPQTNLKRLLAYSSIAQMGYILAAIVAGPPLGVEAAMIYTVIYLFMNLGVFAVLVIVANTTKSEELQSFEGLSKKSLGLSLLMVLLLLSMTGIPPLAGFVGKFYVFASLIKKNEIAWLAVVAIINSVISLYYYFKIAHHMFFKDASDVVTYKLTPALLSCLILTSGFTIAVGLLPNSFFSWVKNFH